VIRAKGMRSRFLFIINAPELKPKRLIQTGLVSAESRFLKREHKNTHTEREGKRERKIVFIEKKRVPYNYYLEYFL
jgi:hypothetical protein